MGDSTGAKLNVEVQRSDKGAGRKRARKKSKAMCRAMEDMRNQTLKEEMKQVALRMLAAGKYALEEIANISGLSLEEVKQLKTDRSA